MARPHRVAVAPAIASPSLPCAPVLAAVSLDGPLGGIGGLTPFALPIDSPAARSGFTPVRGFGSPTAARTTVGFTTPGDGGLPGIPGAPGIPGTPDTPGNPAPPPGVPSSSNAPEPTTWILMIGGFGMLGGAMRYARVTRTA